MRIINASGEVVCEAKTKRGLAIRFVDPYVLWCGQVSEEEIMEAGIRVVDDNGNEVCQLSDIVDIMSAIREKEASKPQFHAPHLQGCNTPHRVRKPWHRW